MREAKELLKVLYEIKELLRIIASNTEQKDVDKVAERLEEIIKKEKPEYLKDMPTAGLVEELSRREGVEKIIIEPYEDKEIAVNGPMIILKVMD